MSDRLLAGRRDIDGIERKRHLDQLLLPGRVAHQWCPTNGISGIVCPRESVAGRSPGTGHLERAAVGQASEQPGGLVGVELA